MAFSGIDVSHHQKPELFNWEHFVEVKSFLIARATYGIRPDEQFLEFAEKCHQLCIHFGAYHFFRQHESSTSQIAALNKQLTDFDYGFGNIYPVLDLEPNERWDGPPIAELHNTEGREIAKWIAENYGKCLIYISPIFWEFLGKPRWILEHEIWIAHWGVKKPDRLADRTESIWQYTNNGDCDGYPTKLDLNICEDLEKITIPDEIDDKSSEDSAVLLEKISEMANRINDIATQSAELRNNVLELHTQLKQMVDIVK